MLFVSFATTSLSKISQRSRFLSGTLSGAQSSRYANILLSERGIARTVRGLRFLRSWPVAGFEAIRIYYLADVDAIHVIRVLHGKRDVNSVLEREPSV
jgi:hypothetical protein